MGLPTIFDHRPPRLGFGSGGGHPDGGLRDRALPAVGAADGGDRAFGGHHPHHLRRGAQPAGRGRRKATEDGIVFWSRSESKVAQEMKDRRSANGG